VFHVFSDVLDENIVSGEFFFVGSEQLLVELKSTALLSINFEVSHGFACLLKLNWVFDVDNG